jgi:signal peptidase II|tara:strand:+ start:593 stop:1075 length:483 start_codon:yes stop_codon:yes gene_type:complete
MRVNIFTLKNIICILTIISIFFLDRISKIKIVQHQLLNENSAIYLNDFLNLELIWNTGIGFGLLNLEAGIIYNLISIFISFIILVITFFLIKADLKEGFLYALIIGGAVGNLYDRAIYFAVPDFIDFHIGNYHWFTFNIADIFITVGIILLIIKEVTYKR